MAARGAALNIRIVSDASGAARGFQEAESRVERFERGLDRASVASGIALGGLALLGREAFNAASDLEQSAGAVESVFGSHSTQITRLAEAAAQSVGLSQSAYSQMAAVLGSQLTNMGFSMDEAVGRTEGLIGVGADLAATFGGTTEEAVQALSSALRGERDPIERFGISLSQAAIDAQVAAMGLDTSTDAAARNANAVATLALIQQQSAAATGAFARESDTAAGAQQRAAAEFENAKAALGQVLLPVVATASRKFAELTGFLVEHKDVVLPIIAVIGGLAAAVIGVNAALTVYRTITTVVTALQWLFNAAVAANPLVLLGLLIAAVVAGVILMYQKFDWFRNFINGYFQVVTYPIRTIFDILGWIWDRVGGLGGIFSTVFGAIRGFITALLSPLNWVLDKLEAVGGFLSDVGGVVSDVLGFVFAPGPAPGGALAGAMYGAAPGTGGGLPAMRGASMGSLSGGTSPSAGQGPAIINVTVTGALDPVAVGRQLDGILRSYATATGRSIATTGRSR